MAATSLYTRLAPLYTENPVLGGAGGENRNLIHLVVRKALFQANRALFNSPTACAVGPTPSKPCRMAGGAAILPATTRDLLGLRRASGPPGFIMYHGHGHFGLLFDPFGHLSRWKPQSATKPHTRRQTAAGAVPVINGLLRYTEQVSQFGNGQKFVHVSVPLSYLELNIATEHTAGAAAKLLHYCSKSRYNAR